MRCKICQNKTESAFSARILNRFDEIFYKCPNCGFLSVNDAHWLPLAYSNALNISDTGLVSRNLYLYKIVVCIATLCFHFGKKATRGGAG